MRHFVAFRTTQHPELTVDTHSVERIFTNKPVDEIAGNTVWVLSYGGSDSDYAVTSVFCATDVGLADNPAFKHFVAGKAHVFTSSPCLRDKEWFPSLLKLTGNFSLGLQEITSEAVIEGLKSFAKTALST